MDKMLAVKQSHTFDGAFFFEDKRIAQWKKT